MMHMTVQTTLTDDEVDSDMLEFDQDRAEEAADAFKEPAAWVAARGGGAEEQDSLQTLLAAAATLLALQVGGQSSQACLAACPRPETYPLPRERVCLH